MAGFKLIVTAGKDVGRTLEVSEPEPGSIKIGRPGADVSRDTEIIGRAGHPDRDLLLPGDGHVSRLHAKIDVGPQGYTLTDCASTNRTQQNGRVLKPWEPVVLRNGDELRLGPDTVVRFELCADDTVVPLMTQTTQPRQVQRSESIVAKPAVPTTKKARGEAYENLAGFAVYEALGSSSAVRVHLAVDKHGHEVAFKRLVRNQLSAKARSTLLTCAQKARAWKHASIAEVVDHGESSDTIFIASRFIEGKGLHTLQHACSDEIGIALAVHWTRGICAALRHAQGVERGFVWRNLNPSNVVIDRGGHAVLINFGLPSSQALIANRDQLDTPEARYLSPEQRRGKETDARSDLYSAGVILYELLGQAPVDARQNVLRDAVGLRPDIPWEVADLVNKAVNYRPERRFIHAADMEEALAAVLEKLAPRCDSEAAAWIAQRLPESEAR